MVYTTQKLSGLSDSDIQTGTAFLKAGETVVFPTDTVYGVGTSAFSQSGIDKLYDAKIRPLDKGIPILLADLSDLEKVAIDFPLVAKELAEKHWPGPLTLIVAKHPDLPANLSPNEGVAVRIPSHELCRKLIRQAGGAVAATSANLSGQPAAQTAAEALNQLDGRVAAVIDGGNAPGGQPSTIISLMGSEPVIVREGPIKIL